MSEIDLTCIMFNSLRNECHARTREFQLYKDPLEAITIEHYSLHYLTKKKER